MDHSRIATTFALIITASLLAGCTFLPGDRKFWYPQGPGDRVAQTAEQQREAEAAQRQPQVPAARPLEVSPELIGRGPAPRTAQATAPASAGPRPGDAGLYTQATRYGDLLFISGQIAMDTRTNTFNERASVEQQTRQVMENIRQILESHRLTIANIVSVTVYMKSLGDFRAMDAAYESYFKSALPSRSVVEVQRLPRDAAVEISVIAGR